MPAISFSFASFLGSLPERTSAAIGSVGSSVSRPSGPIRNRSAGGKHSWSSRPATPAMFGSPSTIRQKIRCSRPKRL